jgi:membrane protease YdiL (CAAX protease family)
MATGLLSRHPASAFFLLTFAIAWAIWIPLGLFAPRYLLFGVVPGAWAPTIAAILITAVTEGKSGVRRFLGRVLKWRVGLAWYGVVLFGTAAIAYVAIGIGVLLGGHVPPLTLPPGVGHGAWPLVLPIAFLINIFVGGPLAEDIGWRGYILPKLRETMSALDASLLIGVVWVVWHLPMFWFPEGRSVVGGVPLLWFALMTIGWSVLMGWAYVNTGSILMPVLFHASINTVLGTLGVLGDPSRDLTPIALNTAVTWAAVALVVLVFGRQLTRRIQPSLGGLETAR